MAMRISLSILLLSIFTCQAQFLTDRIAMLPRLTDFQSPNPSGTGRGNPFQGRKGCEYENREQKDARLTVEQRIASLRESALE